MLEPTWHIILTSSKSMNWMSELPSNPKYSRVSKINKSAESSTEPNTSLPFKKEENSPPNGTPKSSLNGPTKKGMKITSKSSSQKKSQDKLYSKWTKSTWKMFLESSMSKFNRDSWFSFKNSMLSLNKIVLFTDGEEMINLSWVWILRILFQILTKLRFLKDSSF